MIDLWVFLPACFALNLAFGPNNLLSVTYGAQKGVGFATLAGTGRLAVFVPMIVASALGLGTLLSVSAVAFNILKIIGAAYLIYLGVRMLLSGARPKPLEESAGALTLRQALRTESMLALSNPKAILIFAAFFPQFVDVNNYWLSYLVIGAIFLMLEAVAIALYSTLGRAARSFTAKHMHWLQRGSGIGMMIFGGLLLFTRQPARA